MSLATPDDETYRVRRFRPGDRDGYLDLYRRVFGDASREWFDWKYADAPYFDHVPIIVATHGGRVVGAKSGLGLRLRAGDRSIDALQPADTMVAADHRRRGLYSRMTEQMKHVYADDVDLLFNFPNDKTLSGSLKHGWDLVGEVPTYYRLQRPSTKLPVPDPVARVVDAVGSAVLAARTRTGTVRRPPPDAVAVRRHDDPPPELFADLYERAVPEALHAAREAAFYRWRFGNPNWTYRAYVVDRPSPAGLVVGRGTENGATLASIVDVVPLKGEQRRPALRALLSAVLDDHGDADLLAVSGDAIPGDVLADFGFLSDGRPPLSRVASPTHHVAYPTSEWVGTHLPAHLTEPDAWWLTFAEQDTR